MITTSKNERDADGLAGFDRRLERARAHETAAVVAASDALEAATEALKTAVSAVPDAERAIMATTSSTSAAELERLIRAKEMATVRIAHAAQDLRNSQAGFAKAQARVGESQTAARVSHQAPAVARIRAIEAEKAELQNQIDVGTLKQQAIYDSEIKPSEPSGLDAESLQLSRFGGEPLIAMPTGYYGSLNAVLGIKPKQTQENEDPAKKQARLRFEEYQGRVAERAAFSGRSS